jgi:hypothetical protein
VQDTNLKPVKVFRECPAWLAKARGVYSKADQGMCRRAHAFYKVHISNVLFLVTSGDEDGDEDDRSEVEGIIDDEVPEPE